jgi:hypothetical protein
MPDLGVTLNMCSIHGRKLVRIRSLKTLVAVFVCAGVCACGYITRPEIGRTYRSHSGPDAARIRVYTFLARVYVYPGSTCLDHKNPAAGVLDKTIFGKSPNNLGLNFPPDSAPPNAPDSFEEVTLRAGEPVTIAMDYTAQPAYGYPNVAYSCNELAFTFTPKPNTDYTLWYQPVGQPVRCQLGFYEGSVGPDGQRQLKQVTDARPAQECAS